MMRDGADPPKGGREVAAKPPPLQRWVKRVVLAYLVVLVSPLFLVVFALFVGLALGFWRLVVSLLSG